MMNWILRKVIGGKTGKREMAIMVGLIWLLSGAIAQGMEIWLSQPLEFTKELVTVAMWPVMGWVAVAFGIEHLFANKTTDFASPSAPPKERGGGVRADDAYDLPRAGEYPINEPIPVDPAYHDARMAGGVTHAAPPENEPEAEKLPSERRPLA